jgi:DNA-binding NtrC family response regulator
MSKILIIEDDKIKIERLSVFFASEEINIKESFQSGLSEIKSNMLAYDFLVLDMTIPLWEKGNNDLGGNYEQFGGEKILKEMKRRKLFLPTILFTMFDVFPTKEGNITFNEVNNIFKKEFSEFYIGAVFYNSNEDNWQLEMTDLISKIKS